MDDPAARDRFSRIGFAYLALVALVPGVWGLLDPAGWFADFPGLGDGHWVAAEPPYNHHLVIDAASGLFGAGVLAAVAAAWADRNVRLLAAAGILAISVPHAAYHLLHPADALDGVQQVMSTGGLVFGVVVAATLLVVHRPARTSGRTEV